MEMSAEDALYCSVICQCMERETHNHGTLPLPSSTFEILMRARD